jgi:hypothetical protein
MKQDFGKVTNGVGLDISFDLQDTIRNVIGLRSQSRSPFAVL